MKRGLIAFLLVLAFVAGLTSCATSKTTTKENITPVISEKQEVETVSVEQPVTETETITENAVTEEAEEESNWLSAIGKIKGLNVKSYRLRGVGPDGAFFDWIDVKSPKVALSDIRRGEWTLFAEALAEDGTVLATGSLKTFLSESTPLGTLLLSDEVGSGSIKCNLSWNTSQVLYPSIEIYIKTHDGEFVARDKSEIEITENGKAVWTASNVPSGSYIARIILKDEGQVVSGIAAALRVVENKESFGNCQFVIGKLSTVFGIDLQNSPLDTVEGDITLANGILTFESPLTNLEYTWFIDGSALIDLNTQSLDIATLNLPKGYYRFDCIASQENGFSSINTNTVYVYVDGASVICVTPEEADSQKGDVPNGYFEVLTDPENNSPDVQIITLETVDGDKPATPLVSSETTTETENVEAKPEEVTEPETVVTENVVTEAKPVVTETVVTEVLPTEPETDTNSEDVAEDEDITTSEGSSKLSDEEIDEILRYIPEDARAEVIAEVEVAKSEKKGQTADEIWYNAMKKAFEIAGRDPSELDKYYF